MSRCTHVHAAYAACLTRRLLIMRTLVLPAVGTTAACRRLRMLKPGRVVKQIMAEGDDLLGLLRPSMPASGLAEPCFFSPALLAPVCLFRCCQACRVAEHLCEDLDANSFVLLA